jgi:hypothetical protein
MKFLCQWKLAKSSPQTYHRPTTNLVASNYRQDFKQNTLLYLLPSTLFKTLTFIHSFKLRHKNLQLLQLLLMSSPFIFHSPNFASVSSFIIRNSFKILNSADSFSSPQANPTLSSSFLTSTAVSSFKLTEYGKAAENYCHKGT